MTDSIVTSAKAPFDSSNTMADVILLSSDNVDFRVFKVFLSFSSSFFQQMFALPQPVDVGSSGSSDQRDGLPVIPMTESSKVVDTLLKFCYPRSGAKPVLKNLEEVCYILDAAIKYDMDGIKDRLQEILMEPRFVESEFGHLRVFGIAFQYGLKEAAMATMRNTRKYPVLGRPYVQELDHISPRAYHQLLDYHWRCSIAAASLATKFQWLPKSSWGELSCSIIPQCKKCSITFLRIENAGLGQISPSKYWTGYMERVQGELKARPCRKSALKSDFVDDALKDASNCGNCGPDAASKMRAFTETFAKEIERVTSAVELQLDF